MVEIVIVVILEGGFLGAFVFDAYHIALAVVGKTGSEVILVNMEIRKVRLVGIVGVGSVNPDILSAEAGSFTVSNLGNYGVEMFTPVINLPQSAILGVNTIVPRPKDLGDGVFAFVPYIGLSLTYDHRALDGGEATRFLKQIAIEIENLEIEL